MLVVARNVAGQSQTGDTESELDDSSKNMIDIEVKEENERNVKYPLKDEDTSETIEVLNAVNDLTKDIDKLNIGALDDADEENTYQERGPIGGVPVYSGQTSNKSIPVGPMCIYMSPQVTYQNQVAVKGNRRTLDEPENQPNKFFRPPADYCDLSSQPGFQFTNQSNVAGCFTGTNDLSQGPAQTVIDNQQFGTKGNPTFDYSPMTSVQEMYANNFIADGLLDEIDSRPLPFSECNLPNTTVDQFSNNCDQTLLNNTSVKEIRHISDQISGLDSDTGSQSPTMHELPPSVESGHGQSPTLSQLYPVTSSPAYPGVTSPESYRVTPSPANSSGYGSQGQSQLDDGENELLDDAMAFIEADMHFDEITKNKQRPASVSGQQQVLSPTIVNSGIDGPTGLNQTKKTPPTNMVQEPIIMAPNQTALMPGQMLPSPMSYPVTTANVSAPQHIQKSQKSPKLFLFVVQSTPDQQTQKTPVTQFKQILPKPSQTTPALFTTAEGNTTGSKSDATMSPNRNIRNNRTISLSNAQAPQQNKLLESARRKVAAIPRDDLTKSDNEGDTYLHITVCRKDKHKVQALLERLQEEKLGSLVGKANHKCQTPLFLAVVINHPAIVAMLIKFQDQANVNSLAQTSSNDGSTTEVKSALHVAASQGFNHLRTLVELLKAKDILINIVNNYGQTALHCAILAHRNDIDSVEIIRTLIRAGADPSAQDKNKGKTPLMYAIEKTSLKLVDTILITVDPDRVKTVIKTQAFDGRSCLEIAKSLRGSSEMNIWNRLWDSLQSVVPENVS